MIDTKQSKVCSACKQAMPLEAFYATGRPGERSAACKECNIARALVRYHRRKKIGAEHKMWVNKAEHDLLIYTDEEAEFLKVIDAYKTENRRPYPTWTEVLWLLKSLGWKKQ